MNVDRRPGFNQHYSTQIGHWERSTFHAAMRRPEARHLGLSRGDVTIPNWIAGRYARRPHDSGTGR